ncbi:transcriptional regulator, AraC family [Tangfeifania diversioriginum]|uniref:Transcriptional regulator, AraC family n=1 Tax=Tangfeifania diversioriginum TaxID=1168035 RepID=A0A1M6BAI5_9BACT|nr:tetratricopeptide repeat protein [Tangfeifania diversioriginum]SHI45578.1 transcriptional regulator, AraC family [Tangfeifania diversioriginum]
MYSELNSNLAHFSAPIAAKSIAVLPFVNMSGSEEMEYFSDGITEEIINALAQIEQLKVTSRTSSFYFKNKNIPAIQIAKELNVATILEGSVRLAAKTVRITAQLIHAEEDFHFWSETWDRQLENIFEIQDEISLLIAEKLREQYGHFEIQEHLVEKKTTNIDAYEFFLKGRFHFNKWNPVDAQKAIGFYEKAIELDPNHTDSHVGLADAYSFFAVTELMPREEAWKKSRKYMDKAFLLNPEHSGVHYLLANFSFFYNANFQEAFKHALRSVELKSNYPEAQQFVSMLYMILGEKVKAKQHLEIAHSIDPLSQETLFYRAYFHYRSNKYSEALKLYDECLANNPKNIPAYIVRSYCLLKMGRVDEAVQFLEKMPEEMVIHDERLGILCLANILKKNETETEKYLKQLIEKSRGKFAFQAHSYLYLAYATLGKADEAFAWIDEAIKLKSSVLLLSYTDSLANRLKEDPRYDIYKKKLYRLPEKIVIQAPEKPSLLDTETADNYTEKLTRFIAEEEPFLVPNLSLRSLAEQLEIHPNKLSWLLNERMGKNFNEFINYYRIEYFKKLALDPANSHISLLGLAYESGFNSKTVFNTYFKKETGRTPKEFLKENISS